MSTTDKLNSHSLVSASSTMCGSAAEQADAQGVYLVECYSADGKLRWKDVAENVVTTQGKNFLLDTILAGSSYTAAWVLSLYTAGTAAATATYAVPIVTEVLNSVLATRPATAWTAASAGSKASSAISCAIIGSATITGVMVMKGSSTIGDTAAGSAVLLSEGALGASRAVLSGDTLSVTYTLSV
jgi:hypothetical protein